MKQISSETFEAVSQISRLWLVGHMGLLSKIISISSVIAPTNLFTVLEDAHVFKINLDFTKKMFGRKFYIFF